MFIYIHYSCVVLQCSCLPGQSNFGRVERQQRQTWNSIIETQTKLECIDNKSQSKMASADEDDEQILPESLQKLEIVPVAAAIKTTCNKNPFYTIDANIIAAASTTNCDRTEKLFGPMCSDCHNRIDNKDTVITSRYINRSGAGNNSQAQHTIHRPTSFKYRNKDRTQQNIEKNLQILREPILKCIGRSRHHDHELPAVQINRLDGNCIRDEADQLLTSESGSELVSNTTIIANGETEAGIWTEPTCSKRSWKHKKEIPIDFKSLVTDCSHLTLSTSSLMNSNGQSHRSRKSNTLDDTEEGASTSTSGNGGFDANPMNVSTSSNSSSASSTCSQQARLHTSNCDVTIDELASYFETFVHIPKKMSTMAEMMYI